MGSVYLSSLSSEQRENLEGTLFDTQKGACFICEKPIDMKLHKGALDIDHVEPLKGGGKDDPTNFALTHSSCNRSKQASDLRVARILARFATIKDDVSPLNRSPNLADILSRYQGGKFELSIEKRDEKVRFSFPELGKNEVVELPLYKDELSGMEYFFAKIPTAYIFHDDRINPRGIGSNIHKLVEEFHRKRPQLHIALAWLEIKDGETKTKIKVFDGQHKATAQILLGATELPVRVFFNPDTDILLTTNTNAGTTLRQVAFDKSVQRHLGSALFTERVERFKKDRDLPDDYYDFSEKELVNHFKGEWREMKRYVLDAVRDDVTHNPENRLRDYIDFGGKGGERPFSYSAIEKTFYSFFIFGDMLTTPLNYLEDDGESPRQLEKEQILRIMNIIADKLYIGMFDPAIGTSRIENKIQKNEDVPEKHLRAFRLAKEEILYNWLKFIKQIVQNYFITVGTPTDEAKIFQTKFPNPLWVNIETFIESLGALPLWVNRDLSQTVFGGKQNYDFWFHIFQTGQTPQGQKVLTSGINIMQMINKAK